LKYFNPKYSSLIATLKPSLHALAMIINFAVAQFKMVN